MHTFLSRHGPARALTGRRRVRAVIGGIVYRGERYPEFRGKYLFGDNYSGNLFALPATGEDAWNELVFEAAVHRSALRDGERVRLKDVEQDAMAASADFAVSLSASFSRFRMSRTVSPAKTLPMTPGMCALASAGSPVASMVLPIGMIWLGVPFPIR